MKELPLRDERRPKSTYPEAEGFVGLMDVEGIHGGVLGRVGGFKVWGLGFRF